MIYDWHIININSFQGGFAESELLIAATSEMVIILWLIGVIIFQIILLVLVISLCVHQRKKFLRRLKAAMAALPAAATIPGNVIKKIPGSAIQRNSAPI